MIDYICGCRFLCLRVLVLVPVLLCAHSHATLDAAFLLDSGWLGLLLMKSRM
mgnify:CR=1 FL=1